METEDHTTSTHKNTKRSISKHTNKKMNDSLIESESNKSDPDPNAIEIYHPKYSKIK
jgi:hypothetical protein